MIADMYKLLASDLDGTLLLDDSSMPEATASMLLRLRKAGIIIVLSSGRPTLSMLTLASEIMDPDDDEYIISFNGARVVTALSGHVVYERLLEVEMIEEILEYTRERNIHIQGYDADRFLIEKSFARREYAELYSKAAGMNFSLVENLPQSLPQGSPKLLMVGEHEDLLVYRDELNRLSRGRFLVMFSKPHFLEVVPAGVSKGEALKHLANRLNIPISQCIAFGDSSNDIEMIEAAGLGVVVANAREDAKAAADVVLKRSVEESALVELAEKYFL
jgi:Cof subfamily protein (haloacid dehalogenase superfamily)